MSDNEYPRFWDFVLFIWAMILLLWRPVVLIGLVGAITILATPVSAQQQLAVREPFRFHGMVCDSVKQIDSILEQNVKNGFQGGRFATGIYMRMLNSDGEPTCGILPIQEAVITKLHGKARYQDPRGEWQVVWVVDILLAQSGKRYTTFMSVPVAEDDGV
jgi:hypothetical protein